MKKLLILMLVIFSPSTIRATIKDFCEQVEVLTLDRRLDAADFNYIFQAVQTNLNGNSLSDMFFAPSALGLAQMGLAFVKAAYSSSGTKPKWDAEYKGASYRQLLKFRQEIIDLLQDDKMLSWKQVFGETKRVQVNNLLQLMKQLTVPENTWLNWARSFYAREGAPYNQWSRQYVGETATAPSPFNKHITAINNFATTTNNDSVLRAVAHIYRLYTELLGYMLRNVYEDQRTGLYLPEKVAVGVTTGAALGAAYMKLRSGSSAPTGGK